MLGVMKNLIIRVSPLLLILAIYAVNAAIYKGVDSDGNVYFSDQPIENSEPYKPNAISVVESSKVKPKEEAVDTKSPDFKYTKFDIVDPLPNQVIRNEPNISISLQIAPQLNVEQGHKVWLLMDGKPIVRNSQKMSLQIGRVDRGAHKFQAQVKDKSGKIVARTRTVIAHVKYNAQ
jgi:hypothetical protein